MSLVVGVELEVVMPGIDVKALPRLLKPALPGYEFRSECSPERGDLWWGVGYDSSTDNCREFRSPPLSVDQACIAWKPVLAWLRSIEAYVTTRCGIHVHVSDLDSRIDFDKAAEIAQRQYYKLPNQIRKAKWCILDPKDRKYQEDIHHRATCPAREGSYRIEVRLFNASLCLRHMCRSIRIAEKIFQESTTHMIQ